MQSVSQIDGKPQSKTKWEKPEREAETNRRADTERERDGWEATELENTEIGSRNK